MPRSKTKYTEGQMFGRIKYLLDYDVIGSKNSRRAKFECHCGNIFIAEIGNVKRGDTKSCGCGVHKPFTHGDSKIKGHPLYHRWSGIKVRCNNPSDKSYHNYGGRGIKINKVWEGDYLAFKSWIVENIGLPPSPLHTLDRIKNNEGYEPGNLRWATQYEQRLNSRQSKLSKEDVCEIKWLLSFGYLQKEIAKDYNIAASSISLISLNKSHKV